MKKIFTYCLMVISLLFIAGCAHKATTLKDVLETTSDDNLQFVMQGIENVEDDDNRILYNDFELDGLHIKQFRRQKDHCDSSLHPGEIVFYEQAKTYSAAEEICDKYYNKISDYYGYYSEMNDKVYYWYPSGYANGRPYISLTIIRDDNKDYIVQVCRYIIEE